MWSKFAPAAGLIAVGLHGCMVEQLPFPVILKEAEACHKKVANISDAVGLKAVLQAEGCDSLDTEKLKDFDAHVTCADALHAAEHAVLQATCEIEIARVISDQCQEPVNGSCASALKEAVEAWKPADKPDANTTKAEKSEGDEAVVALFDHCRIGAEKFVKAEKDSLSAACSGEGLADALDALEIKKEACPAIVEDLVADRHVILCAMMSMMRDDRPATPANVTHEWIDTATEAYFEAAAEDKVGETSDQAEEARRIRLFQSIVKGKGWPTDMRQPSAGRFLLLGGSALVALLALVVVGLRKRATPEPALLEETPLE